MIEVMPDATTQDFLSRDVDLLVSRIKENLRLKAKPSVSHKNRPSPYRVPSRSWTDPGVCEKSSHTMLEHQKKRTSVRHEEDDPYKVLQELLREGALIKEAVKRLQTEEDFEDWEQDSDIDEEKRYIDGRKYRRKSFYDEEDITQLPSIYREIDL